MESLRSIDHAHAQLTRGFWHERQRLNADTSLQAVYARFEETGRFDALRFNWKEGMPNKPHIFYDSDVAKWMESAAYILQTREDPALEAQVDALVDLIVEHQEPNGYFNVWFTIIAPEKRFQIRSDHELYCAGHLIEAAVAYDQARGKDAFLRAMCRYADHIEQVFTIERSAAFVTPGHPELELALARLYEHTREPRYLELCRFFINERGCHEEDKIHGTHCYTQSHAPLREQRTAEGHSVRACYLYAGMADLARIDQDEALLEACQAIFKNIATRRMYITGGIGSSHIGEAFTVDYDLPNETAYAESCAAISLIYFARRMLCIDPDSSYADVAELALYNGFLSSVSLDGRSFFYENPLSIDLALRGRHVSHPNGAQAERLPITQRLEVFGCSCCPPNITRLIATVADILYTQDDERLYVHHYMDSLTQVDGMTIKQKTNYPLDGRIALTVSGGKGRTLHMRIPGWCTSYQLHVDGRAVEAPAPVHGYVAIAIDADEIALSLTLDMPVMLMEAAPEVHANAGKVALQRGPVVYCIEGLDNGANLDDLMVDANLVPVLEQDPATMLPRVQVQGWRRPLFAPDVLYRQYQGKLEPQTMTFLPYFAFANRGETDMRVFVGVRR